MNPNRLLRFFDEQAAGQNPLVLATVYDTEGSTYSKAGAQMLINREGVFCGMLSGGCLEGDLALRARTVLDTGETQTHTYNLAIDDRVWGLGVGCDGLMRVQLQVLNPQDNYAPFAEIAEILRGDVPGEVTIPISGESPRILTIGLEPPPRLLVLGAGSDTEPLLRIAAELGWRCTVADHRRSSIESGNFPAEAATYCIPADRLSADLNLSRYRMAIIMSHHLESDRIYLRQLAETEMIYIGLLGPPGRRSRLLEELGDDARKLEGRVHGPAGLDIGGRGPEAIALSIAAEMQLALGKYRSGCGTVLAGGSEAS